MFLALVLERKLSKSKILSLYLNKIYWGHGIYGIELASRFYFGKHPLLLSLGESAMLAGIIPAPELRSPFNEPSRGKTTQARALRRMVDVGFLDIETALSTVNQHLQLHCDCIEHPNRFPYSLEDLSHSSKPEDLNSTVKAIWDWERESKICQIREDMERWAKRIRKNKNYNRFCCGNILNIFFLNVIEC
ncbi:Penicillin-binding protein 1a [Thalictrum thalictroides]|uniref:Penicillin-binding protein 1a n=1 Tax=Thalictrum thalictroides TaxID=46969 RepID=A0A7J6WNK4_THATH|nr:Penicillin-binding protein 1a [Thalictrum thalictroides]